MVAGTSTGTAVVTLPADDQILITREFNAPRHLVYKAYTTPELVKRWWTADRGDATSVEIDLRVGGKWRYVMTANGGFEVAFHGEYREIVPPDAEEHAALDTVTFTETGDRTTLTILVQHKTQADRDLHIQSGMEDGLQDALDLLEQIAVSLA